MFWSYYWGMTPPPGYRNPPLVLVVAEIRHTETPLLTPGDIAAMKQALVKILPIHETVATQDFEFVAGQMPRLTNKTTRLETFHSRDKKTKLSVGGSSLVLESFNYNGWSHFRDMLETALKARLLVSAIDGVTRVGLRYIDEVRVPTPEGGTPDWRHWIDPQLVAPVPAGMHLELAQQQAVVQYRTEHPHETLNLRYGAVDGVSTVMRPVTTDTNPVGRYFLLDTDAAWEAEGVPELVVDEILTTANRLHSGVRALFETTIQDSLRDEVFIREDQ